MALKFLNNGYFAGKVGIGTDSLSSKLTISGQQELLQLTRGGASDSKWFFAADSAKLYIGENTSYGTGIKMTLTDAGNVGIGTVSPVRKLQVEGGDFYTNDKSDTAGASVGYGGNSFQIRNGSTSEDLNFDIFNRTTSAWGTPLIIKNTGNVGIGTPSPVRKLEVDFTGSVYGAKFTRSDATGSSLIEFANSAGVKSIIGYDAGVDGYKIGTASATNLVVKQSGNVGIGTTSPTRKFVVSNGGASGIEIEPNYVSGVNEILSFNRTPGATAYETMRFNGGDFQFQTSGSEKIRITSGGNVGIGTTSPASEANLSLGANSTSEGGHLVLFKGTSQTQATHLDNYSNTFRIMNGADASSGAVQFSLNHTTAAATFAGNVEIRSGNKLILQRPNNGVATEISTDSTGAMILNSINDEGFFFNNNGTNAFKLDPINATFAGDVVIDDGVGRLTLDSTSGANRILSTTTGFGTYELLELRAEAYEFKIGTTEKLTIDGSGNATFAGDITIGANHIGRDDDNYIGFESDDLIKFRVAGATQVKISDGVFTAQTDSDVDLGSSGVRFKELWVDSINGGSVVPGSYLPLAGGTMTGVTQFNDHTQHGDQVQARWGASNDFTIEHNATDSSITNITGDLYITNKADDKDIVFRSDDGSGGFTTYFKLDGSTEQNVVSKNMRFEDSIQAQFGAGTDLRIYHDGSNSYIKDTGTGDLIVTGGNDILFNDPNGLVYMNMNQSNSVELYYGGTKKFETGIVGVGTATTTGGTLIDGWITTTQANAVNNTTIATTAYVNNKIALIPAGLRFEGTWDASTGNPPSASPENGQFWIVSVSGSTSLSGITDWKVGDWAIYVVAGAGTDGWQKVDNSSVLDGFGTGQSVTKWDGSGTSNTLTDGPITFSGNNSTFSGTITTGGDLTIGGTGGIFIPEYIYHTGDGNTYFGFPSNNDTIVFATNGSTALTLDGANNATFAGNVAVQQAGDVYLTLESTDASTAEEVAIKYSNQSTGSNYWWAGLNQSANYSLAYGTSYSGANVKMEISTAGEATFAGTVTISKTASGSTTQILNLVNPVGTASTGVRLWMSGTNTTTRGTFIDAVAETTANDHSLRFGTSAASSAPTERMRIDSLGQAWFKSSTDFKIGLNDSAGVNQWWLNSYTSGDFAIHENGVGDKFNIKAGGNVGIGTTSPNYKLTVSGGINAGGVVTYSKVAGSLNTTGYAIAGLGTVFNGASAFFTFTASGGTGQYQRVVYSCAGVGTNWVVYKVIDEGTNALDIEASATSAATIVFTFKTRSGTQAYSPRVVIQASGHSIISTYA